MVGIIAIVDDDPRITTAGESAVGKVLNRIGLNAEDTLLIAAGIKYVNVGLPDNYVRGLLSQPERLELDIAELDFQRLAYERETALRQGYWIPTDEDYVPVAIRYRGQTLHGKARLKGDNPDHYYGEKWSLRFKLDGDDRLDHMGEFGLHAPRTRIYMAEWLYQQALAREGVSGLSSRFVDVTINGKPMGIYGLEEEFDDGIAWYNREPPGPIVRFTKRDFHQSIVAGKRMPDPERIVPLDVMGGNATDATFSGNETAAALRLLEQWRSGELPARDAFDIDRTARYFALSDLLGNLHGDLIHNIRFYYNPITARLEPVGYDANAGQVIDEIKGLTTDPYYRLFFDDPELTERYLEALDRISADGYLEALLAETRSGFQENVSIIYRDEPFYYFSRQPYLNNRETIRRTLHPYRATSAYVNRTTPTGLLIDLGAAQPLPVEVTGVLVGGVRAVPDGGPLRLPGKVLYEPVRFQPTAFTLPAGTGGNTSAPLEIECRVLGTDELRLESVVPAPRLSGAEDAGRLMRLPANTAGLAFAVTDDARRSVSLLPGNHRLAEPLIVPEGYALLCGPATSLDLVRNASIVVRGPLEWIGTEASPIVVGSSDGTGGGVMVLHAGNLSSLVDVHFDPLVSPSASPETGILTFFESPVHLDRVSIRGDGTARLLRLVDSPFIVTGSTFAGGSAPGVSVEFSQGNLTDTLVADGSGLRIAGSAVEIDRGRFARIAGTALLAERESTLSGRSVTCTGTGSGPVAESGAIVSVEDLTVSDAETGVRAGRADAGFEPGRVVLSRPVLSNVTRPFVQEGGGVVIVDGRRENA